MLEESLIDAYLSNDLEAIEEKVFEMSDLLIESYLKCDNEKLYELIKKSCDIRDSIDVRTEIDINREFYYGYFYACENFSRALLDYTEVNKDFKDIVFKKEKLRRLIKYLGRVDSAIQKEVSAYMRMKPNDFASFIKRDYVKKADVIYKEKVGRTVLYSLNTRGRRLLEEHNNGKKISYSKEDIINIFNYCIENVNKSKSDLFDDSPLFDQDIFMKMYKVITSMEFDNNRYYNKVNNNEKKKTEKRFIKSKKLKNKNKKLKLIA